MNARIKKKKLKDLESELAHYKWLYEEYRKQNAETLGSYVKLGIELHAYQHFIASKDLIDESDLFVKDFMENNYILGE